MKLFLPENIEESFVKTKGQKAYIDQVSSIGGDYKAFTSKGVFLLSLIDKYKKVVRQEYFHRKS